MLGQARRSKPAAGDLMVPGLRIGPLLTGLSNQVAIGLQRLRIRRARARRSARNSAPTAPKVSVALISPAQHPISGPWRLVLSSMLSVFWLSHE